MLLASGIFFTFACYKQKEKKKKKKKQMRKTSHSLGHVAYVQVMECRFSSPDVFSRPHLYPKGNWQLQEPLHFSYFHHHQHCHSLPRRHLKLSKKHYQSRQLHECCCIIHEKTFSVNSSKPVSLAEVLSDMVGSHYSKTFRIKVTFYVTSVTFLVIS